MNKRLLSGYFGDESRQSKPLILIVFQHFAVRSPPIGLVCAWQPVYLTDRCSVIVFLKNTFDVM